jgi:thiamine-phosphate pyrophosphorylase
VKLHAIVEDADTARVAAAGGATVIQLRLKDLPTGDLVERGRPVLAACREAGIQLVVNDDVEAALALRADGVHLGQGDPGKEQAAAAGLIVGISASSLDEAIAAEEQGATYIGAGPVWITPTKPDAGAPIGIDGLAAICGAVGVPVVAIGGIDAANARACLDAGAQGVAVVRASRHARAVRAALDGARL